MQAAETGEGIPVARAGGRELPGLVLDLDTTLVACHSEKEQAAPTYKGGFGFHPLLSSSRTPARRIGAAAARERRSQHCRRSHRGVDQALAQIPDAHRHGTDILIRADSAGLLKPSSPTSETCGNEESVPSSRSDTPSPNRSAALSGPCPTASGIPPRTRTGRCVMAPRWPS
ncbi:transposase [Streptomyces tubercidicus]|uniref:transposase n=1 Tax=Streptomyces tubercidicus TaxID=47759 RepID=UPI00346516A6